MDAWLVSGCGLAPDVGVVEERGAGFSLLAPERCGFSAFAVRCMTSANGALAEFEDALLRASVFRAEEEDVAAVREESSMNDGARVITVKFFDAEWHRTREPEPVLRTAGYRCAPSC